MGEGYGGIQGLDMWQLGKALAVSVYTMTSAAAFRADHGLRGQMRRAAVSVPSNIAEGDERGSNRDAVRFFYIAKGSVAELQTQLEIAHDTGYIEAAVLEDMNEQCRALGKKLGSLIKARTPP